MSTNGRPDDPDPDEEPEGHPAEEPRDDGDGERSDEPTEELIEAVRAGDLHAWERLDERYRRTIMVLLHGRLPLPVRSRYDTDDLMQSAMLSAFTELGSFEYRGPGSFGRWVIRMVINRLNGRIRDNFAAKRDARLDAPLDSTSQEPLMDAAENAPPELIQRVEDLALLVEHISALEPADQKMIRMVFFDHWTLERIAEELGVSVRQARRLRKRAYDDLRRRMRDDDED